MKEFIEKVTEMLKKAGLNYKHLQSVFDDSLKNKEELNSMLGLNEENFFRKQIVLDMSDSDFNAMYPYVKQVMEHIPGWTGTFKPTTGKIMVGKDQVNITKFLTKALTENTIPREYKEHLMTKMGIDLCNPKAESQIVPKFGELLNKKATNVVVVSTNPFDFFTSSAGDYKYAAFKSCYRPGGEYFNGCNSLARDKFSTIAYKASADKLDYKHGRAWMFILDKIVAQTKSYGTFTQNERKIARDFVQGKLAEKHQFDPKDFKNHHVNKWTKKSNSNVLYFDDYAIDLGYTATEFPGGFSDTKVPEIKFSNATCLKCGKETQYPTQGICGVCSGNYRACSSCKADLYGGREVYANGVSYCRECVEKKFDCCPSCGEYHEKGTGVDRLGKSVCPTCAKKYYFFCDHCKVYHHRDDASKYTITNLGELWCGMCYKKDGFSCADCGERHSKDFSHKVTLNGSNLVVCSNCVPNYKTCPKCNVSFKGGHDTCDGSICSTCFTTYEYCIKCNQFVPAESMLFDGKEFSCTSCNNEVKTGDYNSFVKEIAAIIEGVKAAEITKTGNATVIIQKMKEDRAENGYIEGDILRIIADNSYHQYPVGALVTNCKKYVGANGIVSYCTFRDGTEWFVKETDVEFARPALVPGDTFVYKGAQFTLDSVVVIANDSRIISALGNNFAAELCVPTDVIDPKALMAISYKVGEVVEIISNTSHHPFNEGDKVKIGFVDSKHGITRYVAKKGTKYGYIFGSIVDIVKPAKECVEGDAVAVKKPVARKKAPPKGA